MNVAVCCKFVPDLQDLEVNADGTISFDKAQWVISEFDLQAIEAAVRLAKETDGKVIAVSVGDSRIDNGQMRKDLLSRGPEELFLVVDNSLTDASTGKISKILANVIKTMDVDVVICGEGSADLYYQQTGIQIGQRLNWTVCNAVGSIHVQDDTLVVERVMENCVEELEIKTPAVLTVTSNINTPPIPNLRAIFSANKKPVNHLELGSLNIVEPERELSAICTEAAAASERKNIMIAGDTMEQSLEELVGYLKADNII